VLGGVVGAVLLGELGFPPATSVLQRSSKSKKSSFIAALGHEGSGAMAAPSHQVCCLMEDSGSPLGRFRGDGQVSLLGVCKPYGVPQRLEAVVEHTGDQTG